jgi:hypothetical protein
MFVRRSLTLPVGFLALAAGLGCSKSGDFATVSGTVTHEGTPVDNARVEFHGTTEAAGKKELFATTTDSSGKYVIASAGKNPGIPPGMYKVVIFKYDTKDGTNKPPEGFDAGQMEAMISDTGAVGGKAAVRNLLPKEYASPGTTKLSVTLETGKNEGKDFALKGKAGN